MGSASNDACRWVLTCFALIESRRDGPAGAGAAASLGDTIELEMEASGLTNCSVVVAFFIVQEFREVAHTRHRGRDPDHGRDRDKSNTTSRQTTRYDSKISDNPLQQKDPVKNKLSNLSSIFPRQIPSKMQHGRETYGYGPIQHRLPQWEH
jgi:hypothetical protein